MSNYTKNLKILNLIKSMALNYTLLNYYGLQINKPILLIVENGEANHVIKLLSSHGSRKITEYDRFNITKEQILSTNSGAVIFSYVPNPKAKELLDLISRIAQTHILDAENVSCPFVVISEIIPNDTNLDDFFTVEISSVHGITEIPDNLLIPDSQNVPYIINKLKSVDETWSDIYRVFIGTLELLKPKLTEADSQLYYDMIGELIKHNRLNKELYDISDAFIAQLYNWQELSQFEKAYELPVLPNTAIKQLENIMAYNKDFVYVKDALLKIICEFAFQDISYTKTKSVLCKEGIIVSDNTDIKTFTCNMGYEDENGTYYRTRMIRLNRHKLIKPGEIEFAELCTANIAEEDL